MEHILLNRDAIMAFISSDIDFYCYLSDNPSILYKVLSSESNLDDDCIVLEDLASKEVKHVKMSIVNLHGFNTLEALVTRRRDSLAKDYERAQTVIASYEGLLAKYPEQFL